MISPLVPLGVAILLGQAPAESLPPAEGDRVVLIGGTMIERDQSYGYLETRWTRDFPGRSITFRNLGWSGDTVEGPSRARFGSTADGFAHLKEHVLALKPTIIVVGYGANEAFGGAAGLPRFRQDLDKLLEALRPAGARFVFLTPTRQEDLGRPWPDPSAHNADLALYRDAILDAARRHRKAGGQPDLFDVLPQGEFGPAVDLFGALPDGAKGSPRRPLTENGVHFNARGYWREAEAIERALHLGIEGWAATVDLAGLGARPDVPGLSGVNLTVTEAPQAIPGGIRFGLKGAILPDPPRPEGGPIPPEGARTLAVRNLQAGRYALKVDGHAVASADADGWKAGIALTQGPDFDQVEALRAAINAKNELYFYRWRPANETYLFGFRKHEQGQNAREIPLFDPLVAAKEAEIARLRVPVAHTYELTREGEVAR